MSQMLSSPPVSPMDHRHFVPRRPSPLSLPPFAPVPSNSSSSYQPFALSDIALATPKTGSRVPRYPLEKQRRAWKEFEDQRQAQQMQRQPQMQVPLAHSNSRETPSPTSTLPLTPRSPMSSASSRYSQNDPDDNKKSKSVQRTFCGTIFGSCLGVFAKSSAHVEAIHMRQVRPISAR
ncbi:hypothetical protein FA15DRAFT_669509 [Coprinopsis marcescibilis]|uniref:Uncharacterized protein n=1 Tax=Coprinopsis marcescibilis TaxID=230819 RepID=A0A5C3KWE2_COPMA|nr:hypothetical protein FA15DRAFT_669509 [Coprinopsis marcescibilis]